jgi:oxalate decarboxylase
MSALPRRNMPPFGTAGAAAAATTDFTADSMRLAAGGVRDLHRHQAAEWAVTTCKVSTAITAALETIVPGGLREMHWHPNADEWQYWIKGEGRMTVFDAGPRVATRNFHAGDIGVVRRNQGHYIQNTGATELQFVAVFKTAAYQEIALGDWLANTPPGLIAQHLNSDPTILQKFAGGSPGLVPA